MAIDAIGISGSSATEVPQNAAISQDAFLKILLTQLQFQDPLKPADNQQFIAQLAQFSSLEINRQTTVKMDSLLTMNATGQAVSLLGQRVDVTGGSQTGAGEVTAVRFVNGEIRLSVRTPTGGVIDARLSQVTLVQEEN